MLESPTRLSCPPPVARGRLHPGGKRSALQLFLQLRSARRACEGTYQKRFLPLINSWKALADPVPRHQKSDACQACRAPRDLKTKRRKCLLIFNQPQEDRSALIIANDNFSPVGRGCPVPLLCFRDRGTFDSDRRGCLELRFCRRNKRRGAGKQ